MPLPDPFPVARLRLHCEVSRAIDWPEYEGSALRGLFGHALHRLACAAGRRIDQGCDGCALLRRCDWPALFAPPPPAARSYQDIAPPFVVEPPADAARALPPGAPYVFDLVLVGPALARLPLVLMAWQQALAGAIGPARGAIALQRVQLCQPDGTLLPLAFRADGSFAPLAEPPGVPMPAANAAPAAAAISLATPTRIKRDGRVLDAGDIDAPDLLFGLVRRVAELTELHLGTDTGFDFAALKRAARAVRTGGRDLHWRDAWRWSNRQQRHTPLGGVVGVLGIEGDLRPFWPLLHLGQWVHVGGKCSFGLGRYHLLPSTAAPP